METLAYPERSGGEQCAAAGGLLHADEQYPSFSRGLPAIYFYGGRYLCYPEICWWASGGWWSWPYGVWPCYVNGECLKILQTVSSNVDREIMEPSLLQLADLIRLTDTTGLLTGEEKISVEGVQVAIQKETMRQRQIEWLQATNNPTDMHIMGLKGRGVVLRATSQNLGLSGESIVPSDDVLDKMQAQQQAQQANPQQAAIQQKVEEGVERGVQMGVQRIATELTAGILATRAGMPEGMPTHIGTPAAQPGMGAAPPGGAPGPGGPPVPGPARPGGPMAARAAASQGNQPGPLTGGGPGPGGLAPHGGTVVGNIPGGGAKPISPGVG